MMRRVLLAGSALALLSGAAYAADTVVYVPPAPPAPPAMGPHAMGYVDASFGWLGLSFGGASADINTVSIGGAANIPFGAWNFELEVRDQQLLDFGVLNQFGVAGHVYTRNASWALGGFVGYDTLLGILDDYTFGLEGAGFFGPFTLVAQGSYGCLNVPSAGTTCDLDLWTIRGVARWFATPDLKVEAGVSWLDLAVGGFSTDWFRFEAEVEYKTSTALALFANGAYAPDFLGVGGLDAWSINLGVRAHLGAGSLLDQDRNGATFDTRPWLLP